MAVSEDIKYGKIFENKIKDATTGFENQYPVRITKIVDSFTAGNVIGKADSDFRLQIRSQISDAPYVIYLEAKATVRDIDFAGAFRGIVARQYAAMVMNMRAGAGCCYFMWHVNKNHFEVWDAGLISQYFSKPRVRIDGHAAFTIAIGNLETFMRQIVTNPTHFLEGLRSTRQ